MVAAISEHTVPAGLLAPVQGPLSRVVDQFECLTSARVDGVIREFPAPVLFSGLAPGFAGVYQLTIRIPSDIPSTTTFPNILPIGCRYPDRRNFGFSLPITFDPPPR